MSTPADRLRELGLTLPEPPKPVAAYIPAVRTGNLIFVSGQVPFKDGKLLFTGRCPDQVSIEEAQIAARQCVLNGLAVVLSQINGDLGRISQIVRLGVFVACDSSFTDHPKVGNGASELLQAIFGDHGRHARAAVGCSSLPLGVPVEVEMLVEVKE